MLGGAELPPLWAVVFLASMAESALQFASLAKLQEGLEGQQTKERYARYLEEARPISAFCVLVRAAAGAAMVALVVLRAGRQAWQLATGLMVVIALLVGAQWIGGLVGRKLSAGMLQVALPALYWLSWPLRVFFPSAHREAGGLEEEPEPEVVDAAKEEIRVAIEDGTAEGALEAEEKEMIEGIMKFRGVDVGQIMTPRTELECLEADLSVRQAAEQIGSFRHSRIPVYEGNLDTAIGIVYVKDVLGAVSSEQRQSESVRDVMRQPLFVPETKAVGPLLQQFQQQHVQIAVVLDEYGGVVGLVTVEDIMEEIVGEIQDEYDEEDVENRVVRRPGGGFEVDARLHIDEVNQLLGVDIPEDEDYDTIGGYVTARLARVPEPGEELRSDGLQVRILQSDERRVRRLHLQPESGRQTES